MFPLIIGLIVPFIFGHGFRNWTLLIGLPLFFLAIISPKFPKYPYKFWISIGNFLGFIFSHLILGAIFFMILFPISILMKLSGHDPLKMKKNNSKSYREIRKDDKIDLNKIF